MSIEEPKIEKKEPIVDVEVNKATLEAWEKRGLNNEILDLIDKMRTEVSPGYIITFCANEFKCTSKFVECAEKKLREIKGKNLKEKIEEIENETRKIILNFAFKELEFNPENPILIWEEDAESEEGTKLKHFATSYPNLGLISDGKDWWLERKE